MKSLIFFTVLWTVICVVAVYLAGPRYAENRLMLGSLVWAVGMFVAFYFFSARKKPM